MKRHGQLMPQIATHENVVAAYQLASQGKRSTEEAVQFSARLEHEVNQLVRELASGAWQPGAYRRFTVRDPKLRVIHAAPFRDRVAHHAILRVVGPLLERGALPHSFACRLGRGNLAAVTHAQSQTKRHAYFLKLDVRRYFDSIQHDILLGLLRRKFKDGRLLDCFVGIIQSFQHRPGQGLPIGTLTSQYFANFYLDGLDQWVVGSLGAPGYVRYMDDHVLWGRSPEYLLRCRGEMERWLAAERGLTLKHLPQPLPCRSGVPFLGYRVTPSTIFLGLRARRRFRSRLQAAEAEHAAGRLSEHDLQRRASSLLAFTEVAASRAWRRQLLFPREENSPEPQTSTASCAAAPGTTTPATAGPPTATGRSQATAGTTKASVCSQLTRHGANAAASAPCRLTRSLEPPGGHPTRRDTKKHPSGVSRKAGWPVPDAPEGDAFFLTP